MKRVIFDIETGPLPREEIERIAPAFNPDNVKTGNLTLAKMVEKIALAKARHIENIEDEAALHAEYGEVLAIGIREGNVTDCLVGDEKKIISDFWTRSLADYKAGGKVWVGFKSNTFDLPFLYRRSLLTGIPIPREIVPRPGQRYWPGDFWLDTFEIWKAGDYRATISLDRFCKAAGLQGKNGSGKGFARALKEERDKAIDYLENDVEITAQLADKVLRCL